MLKLALFVPEVVASAKGPKEAVLLMTVPTAVPGVTWTTKVNVAELLPGHGGDPGRSRCRWSCRPAALLLPQPAAAVQETSVVLAGNGSASVTLLCAVELLLVTVRV